jgi:hypothetical protein
MSRRELVIYIYFPLRCFQGDEVFLGDSVAKVLSSGASTTVVEAEVAEVVVGDVATLCQKCAM